MYNNLIIIIIYESRLQYTTKLTLAICPKLLHYHTAFAGVTGPASGYVIRLSDDV
jgi:hypothetical protein